MLSLLKNIIIIKIIIFAITFYFISFFFSYVLTEIIERQKTYVKGILSRIRQSYNLSIPVSTDETLQPSEVDSNQYVLKPEIASEEEKDREEILHLDLSESEIEDFD